MILQLMKSLYAHDVIDNLSLSVFWKEISSKSKIWYPVKLFDIWIPQTATCLKLEAKLLRYAFAKHETNFQIYGFYDFFSLQKNEI